MSEPVPTPAFMHSHSPRQSTVSMAASSKGDRKKAFAYLKYNISKWNKELNSSFLYNKSTHFLQRTLEFQVESNFPKCEEKQEIVF